MLVYGFILKHLSAIAISSKKYDRKFFFLFVKSHKKYNRKQQTVNS
jgi:hypothetical protein